MQTSMQALRMRILTVSPTPNQLINTVAAKLVAIAAWLLWAAATAESQDQKNVLLVVVDDGAFRVQFTANTHVNTPSLEALAKRNVVFKNGYTSVSSCSPSRSAILTGVSYIDSE